MECRVLLSPALHPKNVSYTILCSMGEQIRGIGDSHRAAARIWRWIRSNTGLDPSPPVFMGNEAIGTTHIIYRYRMHVDGDYLSLRIVSREGVGEIAVTTIPSTLSNRIGVETSIYRPGRNIDEYVEPRPTLPPGQYVISSPIIYRILGQPCLECSETGILVAGLVDRPLNIGVDGLEKYGLTSIRADLHCVTGWTVKNIEWTGTPLRKVLEAAGLRRGARYGLVYGHDGYSAVIPIQYLLEGRTILATMMNGKPLPPEHGGPVRLVVPHLYGWKSVKWVARILVLDRYLDGFWESLGYHERGSPWLEERFKKPW